MVGIGFPTMLGEPTQPAQMNSRRDTVCLVVRSVNSSGCRAVAVRVRDGEVRWQRQLGSVAAAAPVPTGSGVLIAEEDGGTVVVPAAGVEVPAGATKPAPPEWVVATPPEGVSGRAEVVVSPDGKVVFTLTPTGPPTSRRLAIRRATAGVIDHTGSVPVAGVLAGEPVVFGGSLLLPVSDGFVYRVTLGDGRTRADSIVQGPRWWSDRRTPDPATSDTVGFVVPIADDAFVTSDGGKVLTRWIWPATGNWSDGGLKWEVRDQIAAPPLLLPAGGGRPGRLLVADGSGSVWLYQLDKPGMVKRWVPGRTVGLPAGRPTRDGFATQTDAAGRLVVTYVVGKKRVVALDPDKDGLLWVSPAADDPNAVLVGLPQPAGAGRWLVTDLTGKLTVYEGDTGKVAAVREVSLPGTVPQAAGVFVTKTRALVPLSDGSAAVVEFPDEAPGPKGKE
jgi:hypothetical protein